MKGIDLKNQNQIPVYSLKAFSSSGQRQAMFQVEVFDANRHFQVSYPHKHDFYEVLFLTHGSGFHIIDSNKYDIKPPCVFFLSPGQAHKLELSHDIAGFIFLFASEFYLIGQANKNKLLELPFFFSVEQNNPPLLLNTKVDVLFLTALFERALSIESDSKNQSEAMVRAILDAILQTCNQLYPTEVGMHKTRGHLMVKNLLQLIEENYHKNLPVNAYADMLAITPNHLTQLVKQVTGNTTAKLLQNKVIIETQRLLIHTEMNVTEIADYLNFPDQSYFTKFFKKACGVTPMQYRKAKR